MRTHKLFELYPEHTKATNLSILSGGLKLITILLSIAAILGTIGLIVIGTQMTMHIGIRNALFWLMDEWDDILPALFLLWGSVLICGYFSYALKTHASILGTKHTPDTE